MHWNQNKDIDETIRRRVILSLTHLKLTCSVLVRVINCASWWEDSPVISTMWLSQAIRTVDVWHWSAGSFFHPFRSSLSCCTVLGTGSVVLSEESSSKDSCCIDTDPSTPIPMTSNVLRILLSLALFVCPYWHNESTLQSNIRISLVLVLYPEIRNNPSHPVGLWYAAANFETK